MDSSLLLSKICMPLIEVFSSTRCWSIYQEMKTSKTKHCTFNNDLQHIQLAKLLREASNNVGQWQAIFSDINIESCDINQANAVATLLKLPITNKKFYSTGFPDKVTSNAANDDWQYLSSAGTTERMTVVTDFNKRDYLRAAEYFNLFIALGRPVGQTGLDIPPNACNVVCGLSDSEPEPIFDFLWFKIKNRSLFKPEAISNLRGRIERQIIMKRFTVLPIDVKPWATMALQLDQYLDLVINNKIKVLRGLPQFLFWMAKRAHERALHFKHLQAVLPYGGLAGEVMVSFISEVFSAPFFDVYGTGEVGAIGCSFVDNEAVDIYQNLIFIEILDDDDQPVEEGGVGRIVITDLQNFAMPIIRYEIGDIGQALFCNAENNQPSKIKVLGRAQELYLNAQGKRVYIRDFQNLFYSDTHVINFKVEHLFNDNFKVSIVTNGYVDKIALAERLANLLEIKTLPKIKEVAFILPETSGKYLSFKQKKETLYV